VTKVELFEIIRQEHLIQGKSIRRIARERAVHRRLVRMAIENAVPPVRATATRKCSVLTQSIKCSIDQIILDDQKAPRKQRHISKRVYERLVSEQGYKGSLSSVAHYFSKKRKELGVNSKAFIPQHHAPGDEAEVDWYEAQVDFPQGRRKIYFFEMRANHSGLEFHMAFERQNQQSFLEAHVAAFNYFGGIFKQIRYDNLTSAVKKVIRGRKRIETERFIAMRSHYLFESFFCMPGIQGAHEKGGVEGGVGRFRRAHLVPVPKVDDIFVLNQQLLEACKKDSYRTIVGKDNSVKQRWLNEVTELKLLPNKTFDTSEVCTPIISSKSLATINCNYYSVPVEYVGQSVEARIKAQSICIYKKGKLIANHNRCYEQHKMITEIAHYLPLLKHKPGALAGSYALAQARQKNNWPQVYDEYWQALQSKNEKTDANRLFVDFLWWARDFNFTDIEFVLKKTSDIGGHTLDAIKLLMRNHLNKPIEINKLSPEVIGELINYERPVGSISQYDTLLNAAGACL
jgi:transposase